MNTLSFLAPNCITKPSPCDQRSQACYSTIKYNRLPLSKTSWNVHAQAKGFGDGPRASDSIQKKGDAPKKSSSQEEYEDDDKIPSIVFNRMIRRIVASVGLPLGLGIAMLQVFSLLKEKQLWDVPRWVPFITTFVLLGSSVLGVAYGSLSTSWDVEKSGSVLGIEEAKQNWDEMWKEEGKD